MRQVLLWLADQREPSAAKDSGLYNKKIYEERLVAGARFELAIPQARDYESSRCKPVNR